MPARVYHGVIVLDRISKQNQMGNEETELVIINIFPKKNSGPDGFNVEFYQTVEEIIP